MRSKIILLSLISFACTYSETDPAFLGEFLSNDFPKAFFSFPGRFTPVGKKRTVRDEILRLIRNSKKSIYLHVYSFEDPEIEAEISSAIKRGVRAEILGEFGKSYPDVFLPFLRYWKGTGLQHTKVLVVDERTVFIGTGNFTHYGLERDHNGYIEFVLKDSEKDSFFAFLREEYPFPKLRLSSLEFRNSPQQGKLIQFVLTESVRMAREKIEVLIFDHYDSVLSSEFSRFDRRGGHLGVVYDRPADPEAFHLGRLSNAAVWEDGNEDRLDDASFGKGGLLHHKTMLVDFSTLLTGSYNYSVSARDSNREILIRTENPYLVSEFQKEEIRVRNFAIPLFPSEKSSEVRLRNVDKAGICVFDSEGAEFFGDVGGGFFRWKPYYKFKIGQVCKEWKDFEDVSVRLFGGKSEFPTEFFDFLPSTISDRAGNILFSKPSSLLGEEFLSLLSKPILFLRPEFFAESDFSWSWESSDNDLLKALSLPSLPTSAWILSRGKLPLKSVVLPYGASFRTIEPIPANAVVVLDSGNFTLLFCTKSETSKLTWMEELATSAYEISRPVSVPDKYLPWVERSDERFFADFNRPFLSRNRLCVSGIR
ncbi:PLD-like domain protein [Leptospira fletcheri]|uniref:phospholipase D n=1 Tax=Leptospira fletcheri TaxID=2484981 RepID=A0A4R9GJD9_9LEPT|nr:phospholipase D-like domain-containing protein [Leptospira fletcheri]TGK13818.1 PLD-like domain protein [Leptospira fletcheri]